MNSDIQQQINKLGFFRDPKLIADLLQVASVKTIRADELVLKPGEEIRYIPIVLKGCIRVLRSDEDGNEVFLYHLYPGQTCAMSITCCQAGNKSLIKAVAEDHTEFLQIPVRYTNDWYKYTEWKAFISNNYNNRFAELLEVIDLIAFNNMDKQLLHYLKGRCQAKQSTSIEITHQQIADELHTHREAISRLLRTMELKKMVILGRNNIELLV